MQLQAPNVTIGPGALYGLYAHDQGRQSNYLSTIGAAVSALLPLAQWVPVAPYWALPFKMPTTLPSAKTPACSTSVTA